jgi:hypothetical protein
LRTTCQVLLMGHVLGPPLLHHDKHIRVGVTLRRVAVAELVLLWRVRLRRRSVYQHCRRDRQDKDQRGRDASQRTLRSGWGVLLYVPRSIGSQMARQERKDGR